MDEVKILISIRIGVGGGVMGGSESEVFGLWLPLAHSYLCSQVTNRTSGSGDLSTKLVMLSDVKHPPAIGIRLLKDIGLSIPVVLICNLDDLVDTPQFLDFIIPVRYSVRSWTGTSVLCQNLPEAPEFFSHIAAWKGDHCVRRRHIEDNPDAFVEITTARGSVLPGHVYLWQGGSSPVSDRND